MVNNPHVKGVGGSIKDTSPAIAGKFSENLPFSFQQRPHRHSFRLIPKTLQHSDEIYRYAERCRCGITAIVDMTLPKINCLIVKPKFSRVLFNLSGEIVRSTGSWNEEIETETINNQDKTSE